MFFLILKFKIIVAIPVYNRKRIYSVKTKKLRKKYEDDEDNQTSNKEEDNQTSYKEEDNQALYKEQDNQISNKEQDKQVLNKDHDKQASNREEYRSENLVSNKKLTDKSLNENKSYKSNKNQDDEDNEDYQETDEIIKKAIEDDDEDLDELYSNDDL